MAENNLREGDREVLLVQKLDYLSFSLLCNAARFPSSSP